VDGFICSTLTKERDNDGLADGPVPARGGISGKLVAGMADAQIAYVYRATRGRSVIVGCGGVSSAEDAYRKIRLGASLVQMVTGLVYEGPQVVGEINRGLVKLLERDGFDAVAEARGVDTSW
jgi:dihydroorotate dehydrogenase